MKYLHLSDLSGLVVTSEDGDSILEADLKGHQEGHGLDRVVSSINVVAHEEVVGVWELSANHEELTQIMELAVDVTTDGHWSDHVLHV